jgi:hypothetical protein
VLVQAQAVLGRDGVQVGVRLMELPQRRHGLVKLPAEALSQAFAGRHRAQHNRGHPAETGQRLVPVLPGAKVHLGHGVQADPLEHVDQHADLHAVASEERDAAEHLAAGRELARQRLGEPGELRAEEVDKRLGHQLGHPAAAVEDLFLSLLERPPEGALDELQLGVREQRPERAVDEVLLEVVGVGVGEHHDVTACYRKGAPHRVALALRGSVVPHELVLRVDLGAVGTGDVGRAVF